MLYLNNREYKNGICQSSQCAGIDACHALSSRHRGAGIFKALHERIHCFTSNSFDPEMGDEKADNNHTDHNREIEDVKATVSLEQEPKPDAKAEQTKAGSDDTRAAAEQDPKAGSNDTKSAMSSEQKPKAAVTRILIAVNESSTKGYRHPSISSATAFHWVLDKLIKPTSSTVREEFELNILHVQVPDDDEMDDLEGIFASASDFKNLRRKGLVRGFHLLEHFVNICNQAKVLCKAWIKEGDPKEVICNEAARLKPDILVLGCRGLGTLKRIFVGTVSVYCTTHAPCPVLVIKRKPEDTPDDPSDD